MTRKLHVLGFIIIILFITGFTFFFHATTYNSLGLTNEEMVEDFEALYDSMEANYPMFGVAERRYGLNWLGNREAYLERIRKCSNDKEFYYEIKEIINELHSLSNLYLVNPYLYDLYASTIADNDVVYHELFRNPDIDEKNRKWQKIINDPYKGRDFKPSSRVKTKIIKENEIAYLRSGTFYALGESSLTGTKTGLDKKIITEFYKKIKDYPYLVIDIRDNYGGFDYYWQYYLVAPIINERISSTDYFVYNDGYLLRNFISPLFSFENNIDSFPEHLECPPEIKEDFISWESHTTEIYPTTKIDFDGQIYLLINDKVYDSADRFAQFAKDTDWATLVGRKTGNRPIHSSIYFDELPNSGLLVEYLPFLQINPEGRISGEHGTEPDIEIGVNEDALKKVIEIIYSDTN